MTQSNPPDDSNQDINRQLRSLHRRVDRLKYSQVSPQEFSRAFDRVEDEIDALEENMNDRFDCVNTRFDPLEGGIRVINRKFDVVMQYITGQSSDR